MNSGGRLTAPSSNQPREIAADYIRKIGARGGGRLSETDLAALEIVKEYRTTHNGITHILYRPSFQGLPVHNAEFSVISIAMVPFSTQVDVWYAVLRPDSREHKRAH